MPIDECPVHGDAGDFCLNPPEGWAEWAKKKAQEAEDCPGGGDAHEAHLDMNGECPWCEAVKEDPPAHDHPGLLSGRGVDHVHQGGERLGATVVPVSTPGSHRSRSCRAATTSCADPQR